MSRHFSHSLNARYKATFQDYLRFSWQKWEGSSFCQEKPNLLTKDHYMVKPKKEKLARDSVGVHQFVKVCFKVFCIAYQGVGWLRHCKLLIDKELKGNPPTWVILLVYTLVGQRLTSYVPTCQLIWIGLYSRQGDVLRCGAYSTYDSVQPWYRYIRASILAFLSSSQLPLTPLLLSMSHFAMENEWKIKICWSELPIR